MVERAALERQCAGNRTQGSNPCLSAILYLVLGSPQILVAPGECRANPCLSAILYLVLGSPQILVAPGECRANPCLSAILYFQEFPPKKQNHNPRNLPRNNFLHNRTSNTQFPHFVPAYAGLKCRSELRQCRTPLTNNQ